MLMVIVNVNENTLYFKLVKNILVHDLGNDTKYFNVPTEHEQNSSLVSSLRKL